MTKFLSIFTFAMLLVIGSVVGYALGVGMDGRRRLCKSPCYF